MIGRLSWYPVVIICLQYRSISWNPNSMCLKGRNSLIKPFPILMVWITSNSTYARHFTTEWKHTNKIVSAPTIEKNEFKYFQLKLTRNLRNLLISRQKNKNILVNQVQNSDFQTNKSSTNNPNVYSTIHLIKGKIKCIIRFLRTLNPKLDSRNMSYE